MYKKYHIPTQDNDENHQVLKKRVQFHQPPEIRSISPVEVYNKCIILTHDRHFYALHINRDNIIAEKLSIHVVTTNPCKLYASVYIKKEYIQNHNIFEDDKGNLKIFNTGPTFLVYIVKGYNLHEYSITFDEKPLNWLKWYRYFTKYIHNILTTNNIKPGRYLIDSTLYDCGYIMR